MARMRRRLRGSARHAVALTTLVTVVIVGMGGGIGPGLTTGAVSAQIVDDDPPDETPGLGNIVGSPDAGPDPTDAGDRGGWAQLVLAVVVFGGIVFIVTRIAAGVRPRDGT